MPVGLGRAGRPGVTRRRLPRLAVRVWLRLQVVPYGHGVTARAGRARPLSASLAVTVTVALMLVAAGGARAGRRRAAAGGQPPPGRVIIMMMP